jgi:hypothetical protein
VAALEDLLADRLLALIPSGWKQRNAQIGSKARSKGTVDNIDFREKSVTNGANAMRSFVILALHF